MSSPEFEHSVAGFGSRPPQEVVDLPLLGVGLGEEIPSRAALFCIPERAGVHNLFAQECLNLNSESAPNSRDFELRTWKSSFNWS
jgi:hypothetical protein